MARAKGEVTIKDVAKAAGLGVGTVSRVINDRPHVDPESRRKVLAAIESLGYRPNLVARSMRAGESRTLAFVVRDFSGAILSALADAVQTEIDGLGFSLFVASSYHDPARELRLLRGFEARRVDGLIVATSSETDAGFLAALRQSGLPTVLLDRAVPEEMDAVQADHADGMRQAVEHLAALGHQRIALITGEAPLYPASERVRGYREALAARGLPFSARLCRTGSFSLDFAYREARALLRHRQRPTAIIAGGTAMLPGVMHAAQDAALSIPADLSIIGGADNDLARFSNPPVTVVSWDYERLGQTAARFLANRLTDAGHPLQRLTLPTVLIPRGSCGKP